MEGSGSWPVPSDPAPPSSGGPAGAAIVVRIWIAPGVEGFRARILCVPDVAAPQEEAHVVDDPAAALDVVRQCLEKIVGT